MNDLSIDSVHTALRYDHNTGIFVWRIRPNGRVPAGSVAGCLRKDGYVDIGFRGRLYLAHRLAWFYMKGEWPSHELDHRNGVRSDNRWGNIRLATKAENLQNAKRRIDNRSGFKGVHVFHGKFQARIQANGRRRHLGTFDTPESASAAYRKAASKLHGAFVYNDSVGS